MDHELNSRVAKIGMRQSCLCGQAGCVIDQIHFQQQDYGGEEGKQQFDQDPIVPKQAPSGAQRLDEAGQRIPSTKIEPTRVR